jgi:hypothetical protein
MTYSNICLALTVFEQWAEEIKSRMTQKNLKNWKMSKEAEIRNDNTTNIHLKCIYKLFLAYKNDIKSMKRS